MFRTRVSALPRVGVPFALCLLLACALVAWVESPGAQTGTAVLPAFADSAAWAESLRIVDSIAVADSIAFEEEAAAEAAATFGNARSILDRSRAGGFLTYNATFNVNRGNRTWTQGTDLYLEPGAVQVANVTNISITRENRIGRVNRNRGTRTELAYRVTPYLRLGGAFGIQLQSDEAQTTNFTGLDLQNNDISAQARFNKKFGEFPVRGLLSYGYLDNSQSSQNSRGSTFGLFASTARKFGTGTNLALDLSQQFSRLLSTVEDDASYAQDDKNENRDLRFTGNTVVNRWITADGSLSSQRSKVERPARIFIDPNNPDPDEMITVPEAVDGVNDAALAAIHFRLPRGALLNITGNLGRNNQIYAAEEDRTTLASVQSFRADFTKPFIGINPSITYENTRNETDLTHKDPGWVESNLSRKLDVNAGRLLSPRWSTRFSGSIYLTRRRYFEFQSDIPFVTAPTDADNRRIRGSLSLDYKASTKFDTGVTAGIEQNDVVNLARTSSINNAERRTYSVTWNWSARPGVTWLVTQSNSATAAQEYFTFSPNRDQVSFIYNLTTLIGNQLNARTRLEMTNVLRLQSRGSWLADVESGRRFFGKSSAFNTLDLNLRTIYTASDWLSLEAQQRLSVNPNYTVLEGDEIKTSESRRTEFTAIARVNYPFSGSANVNADIRRTLGTDRNLSFGAAPSDRATDNDYWLATISLRKTFGGL